MLYPTTAARGAGRTAALAAPVRICGAARVLSFVPSGPGGQTMKPGPRRPGPAKSRACPVRRAHRLLLGTDSAAPQACSNSNGTGPYTESPGSCGKGTAVPYGEYIGEVGSF